MMLPPSSTPSIKCSTGAGVAAADTGAGVAADTGAGVAADTGAGVAAADTGAGVAAADIGAGVAAADIGAGVAGGDVRFQPASQRTGQTAEDGRPVVASLQCNTSAALAQRAAFACRDFADPSAA